MKKHHKLLFTLLCFPLLACQPDPNAIFKNSLTFYASFDQGANADFALGDPNIYTAKASYVQSSRVLEGTMEGMNYTLYQILKEKGQYGGALEFGDKSDTVVFYQSEGNIEYDPSSWSGTISFWLSLNPDDDVDGYTDPVQITDTNFNDAAIWVDFTHPAPHKFRLGVIGDKNAWTQDTLNTPVREVFDKRIVSLESTLFTRESWTHVLITYENLGTAASTSSLYLNGEKKGSVSGVDDPFTWRLEESKIFLGLNFKGLMDELSIFNKPFSDQQVLEFYKLKGGVKSIL